MEYAQNSKCGINQKDSIRSLSSNPPHGILSSMQVRLDHNAARPKTRNSSGRPLRPFRGIRKGRSTSEPFRYVPRGIRATPGSRASPCRRRRDHVAGTGQRPPERAPRVHGACRDLAQCTGRRARRAQEGAADPISAVPPRRGVTTALPGASGPGRRQQTWPDVGQGGVDCR